MWAWSPLWVCLSGRPTFRSSQWADGLSNRAQHRAGPSGSSLIHIRLEKRKKIRKLSAATSSSRLLWCFFRWHSSLPALSLRTPSPPSSSAVWNTPPCARGKVEGHRSPFFHADWFLCPTTGSTRVKNRLTVFPNRTRLHKFSAWKPQTNGVMFLTCHAMRSLSLMSLSLSSRCSCMYSSVKNAWRKTHTHQHLFSACLFISSSCFSDLLVFGKAAHDGGIHDAVEQHGERVYG